MALSIEQKKLQLQNELNGLNSHLSRLDDLYKCQVSIDRLQLPYLLQTSNLYHREFVTQKLQRPIDYLQNKQRILQAIQNKQDKIKYLNEILPKRIELIDNRIKTISNKSSNLLKKTRPTGLISWLKRAVRTVRGWYLRTPMDTILVHKSDSLKDTCKILKKFKKELINNNNIIDESAHSFIQAKNNVKEQIKRTQSKYKNCLNSNFIHLNFSWHKSTKKHHEDSIDMLDCHITSDTIQNSP